ncbi:MAG: hydantoinase B/oxoprolinase family protein [Pseudomonadota bacterium]
MDPIRVEIFANALRSLTEESFVSLMKSAYSANIKERKDHSTAVLDSRAQVVAQTMASPIHIASMTGLAETLREKYGGSDGSFPEVKEGDVFIANDPHVAGGTHLPDVNLVAPVFHEGKVVAFVCNIAHHADIGGMAAGSMMGGMTEIYQEGLRIPLIRLFRGGELQEDILNLLLLNVRVADERRGDYYAQIAALRLGLRRFKEIIGKFGIADVTQGFAELIDRTRQRFRSQIAAVPDGLYEFIDLLDDDGCGTEAIEIRLKAEVAGERITFDFTGTAPQMRGNLNVTMNATIASVAFAVQALIDPDCPSNQGMLDTIEIKAEPGTIVNAVAPAAVAARAHTCQRIIDVVFGALAPALPEASLGASNGANTTLIFSGVDPRTSRAYVYLETLGGGMGARATKDGKDGVQVNMTNTSNLPVEAIELEYPLLVEEYALVAGSGGAGKHRGGEGIRRSVRPLGHTCSFSGVGERFAHQPWGVFGGEPGRSGRFYLTDGSGAVSPLPGKPAPRDLTPEEMVSVETPGAGGYGPAAERQKP